jgi:hypothetical protein
MLTKLLAAAAMTLATPPGSAAALMQDETDGAGSVPRPLIVLSWKKNRHG